jgi:hypothetical protein
MDHDDGEVQCVRDVAVIVKVSKLGIGIRLCPLWVASQLSTTQLQLD